jgi:23S rRNA (cytidine1920-2'-O)/16S rRNA (cytidine1409-2'-O)-methyltransferase
MSRRRLDLDLVRRGLVPSRAAAHELVDARRIRVNGAIAEKVSRLVAPADAVVVDGPPARFVGRGGQKLDHAIDVFGLDVAGARAVDVGASTGGFTDVLLRHGALEVVAVDVGYGQLAWSLQSDDRVVVHDRTNIRELTLDLVGEPVDLVVGDLSFISLELVLDPLISVTSPGGELALMVKPQFEVGKDRVGKGGVVRDLALRAEAVTAVADAAARRGWGAVAVTTSPLPGPSGNVEFFLLLRNGPASIGADDIAAEVQRSGALGVPGERVDP